MLQEVCFVKLKFLYRCTVRPNKLKHQSLEQFIDREGANQEDMRHRFFSDPSSWLAGL